MFSMVFSSFSLLLCVRPLSLSFAAAANSAGRALGQQLDCPRLFRLQPFGSGADLCKIDISSKGEIGPRDQIELELTFTALQPVSC